MNRTATGTVTCEVCGKKIDERGDYIFLDPRSLLKSPLRPFLVCGECDAYYTNEELMEVLDR